MSQRHDQWPSLPAPDSWSLLKIRFLDGRIAKNVDQRLDQRVTAGYLPPRMHEGYGKTNRFLFSQIVQAGTVRIVPRPLCVQGASPAALEEGEGLRTS